MVSEPPSIRHVDEPRLSAVVELMYLAASADGEFSEEERAHFQRSVESLTDRKIAGDRFDALIAEIDGRVKDQGRDKRIAELREILASHDLHKVGLAMAIQVMAADGIMRTSERELIIDLADGLGIDHDEAADLVAQIAPK